MTTRKNITPKGVPGTHRTGTLSDISVEEINEVLGFGPNIIDDDEFDGGETEFD